MADTIPSRCNNCGSTQFRLDRRNRICCSVCGASPHRASDLEQQRTYENTKRMAATHVRCGHYQDALPFLNQMRQINPDDPDLYYLHLMGLTNSLSDPLVPGDKRLTQACEYYRAYRALGGRTGQFLRYYRRRIRVLQELLSTRTHAMWGKILLWTLGAGGLCLLLWDTWLLYIAGVLVLICLLGSSASHEDPLGIQQVTHLRQQLQKAEHTNDPFFPV